MRNDFSDVISEDEAKRLGKLFPIRLVKHDPKWKEYYEEEKAFLKKIFGNNIQRISHIGSSAVYRLMAKPTIDILLEIKETTELAAITELLLDKGYNINLPEKDIIMYIKGYTPKGFEGQAFHIRVRQGGDWDELYFRDYLTVHPEAAKQYEEIKIRLKGEYEFDRDSYTAAKSDFINKITYLARIEFKNKYKPVV